MVRLRLFVPLLVMVAVPAVVLARSDKVWEVKPPARWTLEDAQQVLAHSPWVKSGAIPIAPGGRQYWARCEVRIRSARPIRMALAHSIASQPGPHLRSAKPADPQTLQRTVDSLGVPNQLLISVRCGDPGAKEALNRQSLRTFRQHAYIELEATERRIHPVGYEAPWQSDLGVALFHFPRPSPENAGKRITFVARFGAPNVVTLTVDFDLQDLQWHGRAEY